MADERCPHGQWPENCWPCDKIEVARLNAQALELCAEMSGLRRRLQEAERLLVEAEAAARLSSGAGWQDYARRAAAFLRPADSAPAAPYPCKHAECPEPHWCKTEGVCLADKFNP